MKDFFFRSSLFFSFCFSSHSPHLTPPAAVHDSLNALSGTDDLRVVGKLLTSFVQKVDFGRDVERQLNFFVECRKYVTGRLDVFTVIRLQFTYLLYSLSLLCVRCYSRIHFIITCTIIQMLTEGFFFPFVSAIAFQDVVKKQLIISVNALAMRTLGLSSGQHNKKTASFVRVCSYCIAPLVSSCPPCLYCVLSVVFCGFCSSVSSDLTHSTT